MIKLSLVISAYLKYRMAQSHDEMVASLVKNFITPIQIYQLRHIRGSMANYFSVSLDSLLRDWFKNMVFSAICEQPNNNEFALKLIAHVGVPVERNIEQYHMLENQLFTNDKWKQLFIEGIQSKYCNDIEIHQLIIGHTTSDDILDTKITTNEIIEHVLEQKNISIYTMSRCINCSKAHPNIWRAERCCICTDVHNIEQQRNKTTNSEIILFIILTLLFTGLANPLLAMAMFLLFSIYLQTI